MIMTIQQVLRPLFVTCFIMGLGFYPTKQEKTRIRWNKYLSILYSLIIWFIYAYIFHYTTTLFTWKQLFASIIGIVLININIFVTIISILMRFYYWKIFEIILKRLNAVNDTLEELGTPKMYRDMHIWSKRIIIGWIIYSVTLNLCDAVFFKFTLKLTILQGFLLVNIINHCVHINTFMDLLFIFLLWYIGNRFDKVNEHMRCLLVKEKHELRCTWKKPKIILHQYNYQRTLWTSMHLHLELCRIVRQLNLMFGTQMTLEMASYLTYLTGFCYGIIIMLLQYTYKKISLYIWIDVGYWIFLFLVRLYVVNYISESIKIKANKIEKIIHQLTNILRHADVRKEIYQFILQTMLHPLKFTEMGFFDFGNTFLRKFCMTIVTYVIIMVQMTISF